MYARLILFTLMVCTFSCSIINKENYYRHGDVVIKRVDYNAKTSFILLDDSKNEKCEIWAEYSGINDGFSGYLVFEGEGKVVLLVGDGYFQTSNQECDFTYKRINARQEPKSEDNVYEIYVHIGVEKERNLNTNTEVAFSKSYPRIR